MNKIKILNDKPCNDPRDLDIYLFNFSIAR